MALSQLVVLALAVTAAVARAEPQCPAGASGEGCSSGPREGDSVARALAAEPGGAAEPQVQLLQTAAAPGGKGQENVPQGLEKPHATGGAAAKATTSDMQEARMTVTQENVSLVAKHRSKQSPWSNSSCAKQTGGTCMATGTCDASRNAECNQLGFCVCPDYTCAVNGACQFSVEQVGHAVEDGVSNVAEQVTKIAQSLPGVADAIGGLVGTVGSIVDTVGGALGELTGQDMGHCNSRYVGMCLFNGCDSTLGLTVSCVAYSCQCKPGFCASGGSCVVDLQSLLDD